MISTSDIQKLRTETGFGIIECKKALENAKGKFSEAKKILLKTGAMKAQKRADKSANQGIIEAYVHDNKIGVILELNCETDFVSSNPEFREFAHDLAMQIASMKPKDTKELLKQGFIKDMDYTISDLLNEKIGKIGENIKIKRFARYELGE